MLNNILRNTAVDSMATKEEVTHRSVQDIATGVVTGLEREQYTLAQRTLAREIEFQGISVHSGESVRMRIVPAAANRGIVFITQAGVEIPATITHIAENEHGLSTVIGSGDSQVSTIEHLMAAFATCGVDNAEVHLDGSELPIMDGSAQPFVDEIRRQGLVQQNIHRRFLRIIQTFTFEGANGQWLRFDPLGDAEVGRLNVAVDYHGVIPVIGAQSVQVSLTPQQLRDELMYSRTFGLESERVKYQAVQKGLGASCDNAVIYDGDQILNPEGLRSVDEAVRHKALDLIGDLYLAGWPLLGHISAFKPSHRGNAEALKALLDSGCCIL